LESLTEYARSSEILSRSLKLFPGLAVRHAGSEVFQEAHVELIRSPASDLFGYVGPAEAKAASRGGAHFTPPALARSLCEQTLAELGDVSTQRKLTVMDPACGSGAFLHEAMRTLRRLGFNGKLRLIGWDISAAAATMAEFIVRHGARDWIPQGGLEWEIHAKDSLAADMPKADVVLMNPPFISWVAMSAAQQHQMRSILEADLSGRGDFSMAFVTKAMRSLAPHGVLGALLPSSLLSLESAESWRGSLLDKAALRFIAALGDHGVFAHALVSVAAMVLKVREEQTKLKPVTALVTANTADATGEALRAIRREDPSVSGSLHTPGWRLFSLPETVFRSRPTWRLTSPETESVISRVIESGALPVETLFDVRQGVRTGFNKAFLLSAQELSRLPATERRYFRPATVSQSISFGSITPTHFVFYPHTKDGDIFASDKDLRAKVPRYFHQYLEPNATELKSRNSNRGDWWGLSEKRAWALSPTPRIISKYFGDVGGFAVDIDAEYVVVQGYAWIPKWLGLDLEDELAQSGDRTLLYAYNALFNSRSFGTLVEVFSPHVAGGQFDLSPRYVKRIPIPDLPSLMAEDDAGALILKLAELGKAPKMDDTRWHTAVDRLVGALYGGSLASEQ
jgi:adenine-specific DNA-methyltransferase